MPTSFLVPIVLRLAGPIAFLGAAMTAGAMNRSVLLVPLLAIIATVTTLVIRKVSPSPVTDMKAVLSPDADPAPTNLFRGIGRGFASGLVGYSIAFGFAALIAALFQTTEFEPQLMVSDTSYLIVPTLISVIGAWFSARIGMSQMAGMMDQMQDMMAQMQAAQSAPPDEDEAFTVDGEVIDPEPDRKDL
nr:hypothetical protein [Hyphomonas sp. Mor2]